MKLAVRPAVSFELDNEAAAAVTPEWASPERRLHLGFRGKEVSGSK